MTASDDDQPTAVAADHDAETTDIPDNVRTKAAQLAYSEEQTTADYDDKLLDDGEEPRTEGNWRGRLLWAGLVTLVCATVAAVVWFSITLDAGNGHTQKSAPSTSIPSSPIAPVAPSTEMAAPPPSAEPTRPATQGIDPSRGGPAVGSACVHADMNETTVSNTGAVVRCMFASGGYQWQPDTGEQVDPVIVGQPGWDKCLKMFPVAKCSMAAAKIAGTQDLTEPVGADMWRQHDDAGSG